MSAKIACGLPGVTAGPEWLWPSRLNMEAPIQITVLDGKHESWPAGAYNPDDDQYLVAWKRFFPSGTPGDVFGRRLAGNGTVLTGTIEIAMGAADEQRPDVVYLDGAGRYAVVWEEQGSDYDLYGRLISSTGTLDGSKYLLSAEMGDEQFPRMTSGGAGRALVVWHRDNGGAAGYDLYGRWLGSDGLPLAGGFALLEANDNQQQPFVAGDGAGCYLLAWQDDRNGDWDVYASLFQPLQAGFAAAPTRGLTPLRVEFTDQATPTGAVDEWLWSFGDGVTSTLASPVHTYREFGIYTVTQWVSDTVTGETDALTRTYYITALPTLVTTITYDYDPLYRLITAAYSSGQVFTYTYDAGDPWSHGNRLEMGINGQVTEYDYDEANRLTKVDEVEYDWDDGNR